jgi:hypothetical protein
MNNTANDTYENRCKGRVGEDVFESHCKEKGIRFFHTGFDEREDPIKNFWDIHPMMRGIPDYLVENSKKQLSWVHVKGTPNFKINDLLLYSQFDEQLRGNCGFFVAFCFKGGVVKFLTMDAIKKQLTGKTIKEWDDGKQYITLNLS